MKKLLMAVAIFCFTGLNANASEKWMKELESYSAKVENYGHTRLFINALTYSGMLLGTCSASATIVAATALADSFPLLNIASEGIANLSNDQYMTVSAEDLLSLEALADTGRGGLGGGVVGLAESIEFIFLWLAGREDEGFAALKKVYASTFATTNALFAQQGKCLMSFAKLAITLDEMEYKQAGKETPSLSDMIMP